MVSVSIQVGLANPLGVNNPGPPAFSPADVVGLAGWYDAQNSGSVVLSGLDVTEVTSRTGGAPVRFHAATGRKPPTYNATAANGRPALVYEDDGTASFLALTDPVGGSIIEANVKELFVVMQYRDGTQSSFRDSSNNAFAAPLMSGLSGIGTNSDDRIIGGGASNKLFSNSSNYVNLASKNGGSFSSTVLPMPLSVVRFSAAAEGLTDFPVTAIGAANAGGAAGRLNSWSGLICEVLAYSLALSAQEVAGVEGYLMAKWGISA